MNSHAALKTGLAAATATMVKKDPNSPALLVTGRDSIAIKAGTIYAGVTFDKDTPVVFDIPLEPGCDYVVVIKDGAVGYAHLTSPIVGDDILGGFHFAPGGSAAARKGGDEIPAINPYSLWDLSFRPVCPDPRGMVLVDAPTGKFWCDIYLLGVSHVADGTSKLGATIADGDDPPAKPNGKHFSKLDYDTAVAVMKHHGKGLLSVEEFFAAALGVTEKTAHSSNPRVTALDAPRTSKFGLMQATGNMWVWGHDGDPDEPRASFFGGSWLYVVYAGSRYADVACVWPDSSDDNLGARGRCDHLQLA
jgi:hypothetical protein